MTVEKATKTAFKAALENAGQCCVAATRTLVQSGIYDRFVERMKKLAAERVVGDPFSEGAVQGPQVRIVLALSSYKIGEV